MPSERIQARIDAFLAEADAASTAGNWAAVSEKARAVLAIDEANADAAAFLKMAAANSATAPTSGFGLNRLKPQKAPTTAPPRTAPSGRRWLLLLAIAASVVVVLQIAATVIRPILPTQAGSSSDPAARVAAAAPSPTRTPNQAIVAGTPSPTALPTPIPAGGNAAGQPPTGSPNQPPHSVTPPPATSDTPTPEIRPVTSSPTVSPTPTRVPPQLSAKTRCQPFQNCEQWFDVHKGGGQPSTVLRAENRAPNDAGTAPKLVTRITMFFYRYGDDHALAQFEWTQGLPLAPGASLTASFDQMPALPDGFVGYGAALSQPYYEYVYWTILQD